jgi:hypothetical protein
MQQAIMGNPDAAEELAEFLNTADPLDRYKIIEFLVDSGLHVLAIKERIDRKYGKGDEIYQFLKNFTKSRYWSSQGEPPMLFASGVSGARGLSKWHANTLASYKNFFIVFPTDPQAKLFFCDRCGNPKPHPYKHCISIHCPTYWLAEAMSEIDILIRQEKNIQCIKCGKDTLTIGFLEDLKTTTAAGFTYPPTGICNNCGFTFNV